MEYGIWNMEYGIWNMEYGIWNMEYGGERCIKRFINSSNPLDAKVLP
jgi:hypothetical protein